jgi:hypothetical protein
MAEAHEPALLGERALGEGLDVSVRMTASPAPPCRVPLRAPTPPATAECMSDRVEVMTRVVKVEAFSSCSA